METSSDDASGSGGSRVTDALDRLTRRLRDVVPAAFDPQDPGDEPAPEAAGPLVPPALLKLQRYVVLAPLGRGGMGMVYLAHSRSLPDRQVALKVLPQAFSMDPKRLARFRNEATTASRIDHVGVARVLEIGEEAGIHFLVQELVPDGRTLADRIREARDAKTLPRSWYREVARIFASVAHAMAAVHASNVLHRDLKPSNILLLPNGEPKVADFGLAKDLEAAGGMSGPASPGTLNYKSPEQVDGRNGPVTERSDVFALGATLYEALMFAQLFPGDDPAEVQPMILHREVEDLRLQRPSVPKDLSVICRKCLEKEPSRRFAAMAEVAAELERHLRDEPILATEPGWVERAWKWRRRHPAASATMAVTTLALGVVSVFAWKLDATASAEALAKAEAQRSIENFEQLSGVLRLEELVASKHSLWPLGPVQVPALVTWLEEASKLLALRPRVEETIAELRTTAVPMTVRLSELEQRKDAAWNDLVEQRRVVGSLRRAEAIRTGKQPLELPPVDGSMLNMRPRFLEALAWPAIAPARPMLSFSTSQGLRGEALALTVARLAASLPLGSGDAHRVMDTLAWAELANGQDEEAIRVSAHALAIAPLHERPTYARFHKEVKQAVTEAPQRLVAAESRLATLEARVATRTTWSFPRDSSGDSARVLHDDLVELLVGLEALENLHMPDVAERQRWSEQVDAATARHPRARTTWDQARAAVTRADGATASTRYSGTQIDIPALGWPGLVPIGMNPVTRLWEFYDLWTAWDGRCELGEIPIPCHRADGSLELEGDLGVVFVLLPGGTVQLGAQDLSPGLPLYDPQPGVETMLRDAHLPPFLVARHELTEAQWGRLERDVPAPPNPWEQLLEGLPLDGSTKLGGMRPASGQDGATFLAALKRHGMELPTEDQWEHACRGGGITPWQVHLEALHTHANLASTELYGHSDNGMPMPSRIGDDAEDWSDGFLFTAPVGSLLPNDYGLHDMHGNVAEWCVPRAFGGLPRIRGSEAGEDGSVRYFVLRGGSFHDPARRARSGHRSTYADTSALATCGARPVRLVPPYHQ